MEIWAGPVLMWTCVPASVHAPLCQSRCSRAARRHPWAHGSQGLAPAAAQRPGMQNGVPKQAQSAAHQQCPPLGELREGPKKAAARRHSHSLKGADMDPEMSNKTTRSSGFRAASAAVSPESRPTAQSGAAGSQAEGVNACYACSLLRSASGKLARRCGR